MNYDSVKNAADLQLDGEIPLHLYLKGLMVVWFSTSGWDKGGEMLSGDAVYNP